MDAGLDKLTYPISEVFLSQQGEGYNTGAPVVFVRMCGCNRSCSWCDEGAKLRGRYTPIDIFKEVNTLGGADCTVVLTGGEPTIHNLHPLVFALRGHRTGHPLWIESNGTGLPYVYSQFDYVAISPKLPDIRAGVFDKFMDPDAHRAVSEIRVVVDDDITIDDLSRVSFFSRKYLSPVFIDGSFERGIRRLYDVYNAVKAGGWQISIQTHKLANVR